MIIQRLNGRTIDIWDHGLARMYHNIPSAEVAHVTSNVEGLGETHISTTIGQRTITVDVIYQVKDIFDYYLLRDELNALLMNDEPFYIIFKREPYKRWFVKLAEGFKIPPAQEVNGFELKFRTVQKYAESVANTLSMKEWDSDVWAWNDSINWDDPIQYTFHSNIFTVVNRGNVTLDPREFPLSIQIKAISSGNFRILNRTTGDEYGYNGTLQGNDTLEIKGVQSLKNGVSVFRHTNHSLIKLAPGPNEIEIYNGMISSVKFDFRFPYL